MLRSFLVYCRQFTFIFCSMFFSIIVYHRILNVIPGAVQQDLVVYLFYIQQLVSANPKLLIYFPTPFPLGNREFVFCVCESVSRQTYFL